MKKFCFLLLAMLAALAPLAAQSKYAQASFPVKTHDFGTIKEAKGPVSASFEVVNTGNAPLIIVDASASCGCTRPQFPTKPIKPGKKAKVKVTFSPIGRPGAFRKTIRVKTNGREKSTVLVIEGVVIPKK